MKSRMESIISAFISPNQIDWLRLCQGAGEAGISASREQLRLEPATVPTTLLYNLLKIACETLKAVDPSQLLHELERYKAALDEYLSLEKEGQAYFDGDYEVFSHFMVLLLDKKSITSLKKVDELWPNLEQEQGETRYEDIVRELLAGRVFILFESYKDSLPLTPQDVERWDEELCLLLSEMLPHAEAEGEAKPHQASSFLKVIWIWFNSLFNLWDTQKPQSPLESFSVLNSIWSMAKRRQLLTAVLKDNGIKNYFATYQEVHELDFSQIKRVSETRFTPVKWFGDPIKEFVADCNRDLQALETWASALFHSVVLTYLDKPDEGAEAYLDAFNKVREEIRAYGISLYACRMKAEQAWQGNSNYLRRLDKFDAELADIDERLNTLQRDLVQDVKESLDMEPFQAACTCFEVLVSKEMEVLNKVSWAGLTCYSPARNEETLAYEMNARNEAYKKQNGEGLFSKYGSYSLYSNRTQTDYLMTHCFKDEADVLLKGMRRIHPDHLAPGLAEIANYCSTEVLNQRNYHMNVSQAWYAGQWYEAPSSEEKEKEEEDGIRDEFRKKEPTIISEPENSLGLGMLSLHHAYITWVKDQTSLIKKPRGSLGPQHSLYSGKDDEDYIGLDAVIRKSFLSAEKGLEEARARAVIQDAQIHEIEKEIAEDIQQKEEAKAQTKIEVEKRKEAEAGKEAEAEARRIAEAGKEAEAEARRIAEAAKDAAEGQTNQLVEKLTKLIVRDLIRELEPKLLSLSANPDSVAPFLMHLSQQVAEHNEENVEHVRAILDNLLETQTRFAPLRGNSQLTSNETVQGSAAASFFAPAKNRVSTGEEVLAKQETSYNS